MKTKNISVASKSVAMPMDKANKYPMKPTTVFASDKGISLQALTYAMNKSLVDYTLLQGNKRDTRLIVLTPKTLAYQPNAGSGATRGTYKSRESKEA